MIQMTHDFFFKKKYIKTQKYIFGTGRDRDDPILCPIPKMNFVPSQKFSGWEKPRDGM